MTSHQPIAVLGATGNQGGHVARALLEAGWPVRAITRHPESPRARALASCGAELIQGDMGEVDTLIQAFDGAHGIFSVQNFWELGLREEVRLGTNVITAAQAVGRPHVIYSSGLGAEQIQGVAAIDGKAVIEGHMQAAGLPFTILRPALFMDDLLGASLPFASPIQLILRGHRRLVGRLFLATLRGMMRTGDRIPLTTLRDIARIAVWAWAQPDLSNGQVYTLVGSVESPDALCHTWKAITGVSIPVIPGLAIGIRLFHRHMSELLDWLPHYKTEVSTHPLMLQHYRDWLEATLHTNCSPL